jgi:hypothetical protein
MIGMVVRGSSMKPSFSPGTVVAVSAVDPGTIRVGNVIVFRDQQGNPVIHRVRSTRRGIVTQGDNLPVPDGVVAPSRIVGRVVGRWRGRRLRRISRLEEILWLPASVPCRQGRRLLRAGGRLLAPLASVLMPLRRVRYRTADGQQTVKLYLLRKPLAWSRNAAGGRTMWVHPWFEKTTVARRMSTGIDTEDQ